MKQNNNFIAILFQDIDNHSLKIYKAGIKHEAA